MFNLQKSIWHNIFIKDAFFLFTMIKQIIYWNIKIVNGFASNTFTVIYSKHCINNT